MKLSCVWSGDISKLGHVWYQAGDNISDEAAIEAARQAQILDTLTALPDRLDTFLGSGGGP